MDRVRGRTPRLRIGAVARRFGAAVGVAALVVNGGVWAPVAVAAPGSVVVFGGPSVSLPREITVGPDGALWFANWGSDSIGRITTSGVISSFTGPGVDAPWGITTGPDGALWFTNDGNDSIGRITKIGRAHV